MAPVITKYEVTINTPEAETLVIVVEDYKGHHGEDIREVVSVLSKDEEFIRHFEDELLYKIDQGEAEEVIVCHNGEFKEEKYNDLTYRLTTVSGLYVYKKDVDRLNEIAEGKKEKVNVFKLVPMNDEDVLKVEYYEGKYHVIIKDPSKVVLEKHWSEPSNAEPKEYLKINPNHKDPDYYRQGGSWFRFIGNELVIDQMVINELDTEFERQYKSC